MSDIGRLGGAGEVGGTGAADPSQTWSVDQENQTITLDNGYSITLDGEDQSWHITDAEGNEVKIWGDPHVYEGDGGKWDFKAQMTFELEDGTKITVKTKPIGDGSVTVSDELIITKGDQSVHVTGIADDNPQISEVGSDGVALDRATDDGYVAREQGSVEDWSFGGKEITHNLPFVDYETYVAAHSLYATPPGFSLIDPNNIGATRPGSGLSNDEIVQDEIEELQQDIEARLAEYRAKMNSADNYYEKIFYEDLVNALQTDVDELEAGKNSGSLTDKVNLYNRIAHEYHLEVKYNINLTSGTEEWSEENLQALDAELSKLPEDFTVFDINLREIRRDTMKPGVGAVNYGGLISTGSGGVSGSIIHEIGHDFDNENPRWEDFLAVSGWENHTSEFSNISTDFTTGADGVSRYTPYDGYATYSDGKVYHDGDPIDLDGDGVDDGIVQVHYGKVFVCDTDAPFVSNYAGTNPMDDFAECFEAFFKDPQGLKDQCPDKYAFMVEYIGYDPLAAP